MGQFQRRGQFEFVALPRRVNRKHPIGHDQYHERHITGQIHGTIEALSPIHIGSGVIDLDEDVGLIKTAVRTNGNVVIPGSSLKGAIRSAVEAISESCVCKVSRNTRYALSRDFMECRQRERLCIACRMFGAMGFQSNIAIQDAPQINGRLVTKSVPELYRPRPQRRGQHIPGRKFYMHGEVAAGETPVEACEIGSKFRFVVQVDNLTQAEWGLFFAALGHHHEYPFKLKIGGIKPACFGSIAFQIKNIQVEAHFQERYLDWNVRSESVMMGEQLETWQRECTDMATDSLIKRDLLAALAQILQHPNDRNCPSGLY